MDAADRIHQAAELMERVADDLAAGAARQALVVAALLSELAELVRTADLDQSNALCAWGKSSER
jgi:hypothetical protein